MELDARAFAPGTQLETDLCIVGAGPAGLSVASELIGSKVDVVILESGGWRPDPLVQDLNAGSCEGDPYAGLELTRHRQVGGTTQLWNTPFAGRAGAKFAPLDPCDFEERGVPLTGWPLSYSDLEPYYDRARIFCGLAPLAVHGEPENDGMTPPPVALDDHLTNRVYQFGTNDPFTELHPRALRAATNVRLCHHATACRLEARGRRVVAVQVARSIRIRANRFVLALGAIENARLLLLSEELALGESRAWVGRCFMEHPRDRALSILPRSADLFERAAFYDLHASRSAGWVGGRIGLAREAMLAGALPNASVTLLPRAAKREPRGVGQRVLDRLRQLAGPPRAPGYGWSHVRDPARRYDSFHVLINLEQQPRPENRVLLGAERDRLGLPRPVLHWQWRPEESAGLERLRLSLARWLEGSGLGRVEIQKDLGIDPNAHHHAGTTRMHDDPASGVVDATGRTHGIDNLYLTGASVFPTCGWANPTLTIAALGLRLADHLAALL